MAYLKRRKGYSIIAPPPPERFHPSGQTNYQAIEEPILKGEKEDGSRLRLEIVHPMVEGAENFIYQIWPVDQKNTWVERFGTLAQGARCWRLVKEIPEKARTREIPQCAVADGAIARAQESKFDKNTLLMKEQALLKEKKALKKKAALEEQAALKEKKALKKKAAVKE